ncbi:MAG: GreA/GreB family elongation factor [Patescibacteria group bacterium]
MTENNIDKKLILAAVIAELERQKRDTERNASAVHAHAVEAPSPMESHSDQTRYEMNTLHENLRAAIETYTQSITTLANLELGGGPDTAVGVGSVVRIEDAAHQSKTLFLLPEVRSVTVVVRREPYTALSQKAPLGAALVGKRAGDVVSVNGRIFTIVSVE